MAITLLDSMILTQAVETAWSEAIAVNKGNVVRAAESIQNDMANLASSVAIRRGLAAQLEVESSPEALRRRAIAEQAKRDAAAKIAKQHDEKMTAMLAQISGEEQTKVAVMKAERKRQGLDPA